MKRLLCACEERVNIAIHDGDANGFPNLALMKISAWHKSKGDTVEWWNPLAEYDRVYSSKVFTFTPECEYLPPDTIKGGTGYGLYTMLSDDIDRVFPDYSIYPECDFAIGFLTRGCIRKCPWCVVPRKEGFIKPYMTWQDIKRPDSRDIVFMDNNVLACKHGIQQLESMVGQNIRIDFNQGLDARLITPEIARLLSKLKWIRFIRMSCDTDEMLPVVMRAIELLKAQGVKPYRVFVYLLVQDIESAERRAVAIRSIGAEVFAQPYRDFENKTEPTDEMKALARWVNHKAIFKRWNTLPTIRGGRKAMQTEIIKIKGDWEEVVNDCRTTVGKEELGREPSDKFKREILIAEHSPIRDISIKWRWRNIPYWVTNHWVRHKWEKFVSTQRTDRTGIPRDKLPQDEPQTFVGEANAQHLIDTYRKRLCRTAAPDTRKYAKDFKRALREKQPQISDVLVPNCVYRCGCPELHPCSFWKDFKLWCWNNHGVEVELMDIQSRYDMYNEYFHREG